MREFGACVDTALQARGLRKRYVDEPADALVKVNLVVRTGTRAAVVGPPACGKSTLLRVLAGRVAPTQGWVTVLGQDPIRRAARLRRGIGWIPHRAAFPKGLTVEELGALVRRLSSCGDAERFAELCVSFGLESAARADRLSSAEQRLAGAALALQKRPAVVLVDAPDGEVDTREERAFLRAVMSECPDHAAVLAASRGLDAVMGLVSEIFLMREGLVVDRCVPDDMMPRHEIGRRLLDSLAPALPDEDSTAPAILFAVTNGPVEHEGADA